jgi:hypothetical protein
MTSSPSMLVGLAAYTLACALGCSSSGAPLTPGRSAMTDPISLSCSTTTADGVVTLHLEAVNRSAATVHVLASERLPYVLFEDGRAVVLYGVNDPDPDLDYYGIEIPLTRPLAPGDRLAASATIVPLVPRHHYEAKQAPVALPAELEVVCKLAYGEAPIDEARRGAMAINGLLAWQRWVTAPPLRVSTRAAP